MKLCRAIEHAVKIIFRYGDILDFKFGDLYMLLIRSEIIKITKFHQMLTKGFK